jgi:hypothetical protein
MAENQDELKIGIGNEEAVTLKPTIVKVLSVEVGTFGNKNSKKVVCEVKHPDSEQPIKISSVKYESKKNLETSGLWVNKDSKGLIRKGSALAVFLNSIGAKSIEEVKGKEIQTAQDDKGYLCFKAY